MTISACDRDPNSEIHSRVTYAAVGTANLIEEIEQKISFYENIVFTDSSTSEWVSREKRNSDVMWDEKASRCYNDDE